MEKDKSKKADFENKTPNKENFINM